MRHQASLSCCCRTFFLLSPPPPESILIMSFVISPCQWLCGYGWQLLMKSPPQILPDFKPCHTLPLTNSAAVTFWSLCFSIPFSTGALRENNLMMVAQAIDISNSSFRSYFAGAGYPFLPITTECQPFGAGSNIYEGLIHRPHVPPTSLECDAFSDH